MATPAKARDTLYALRHKIASIEGRLAETLEVTANPAPGDAVLRRNGRVGPAAGMLATGIEKLDAALGGGLPSAALTEIHGTATRDAGAVTGFVLALVSRLLRDRQTTVLWIGTSEIFREAGFPYALGIRALYGIDPERLLVAQAAKLADALWIAEEASRIPALSAVLLEIRGNPAGMDLTSTRRLHRRAQNSGRPVFLLREAAEPEPTAAPVRLVISPASAGLRHAFDGPLVGSIGPPAFILSVSKNRNAPPAQFTLEWNSHARTFRERGTENPVAVVSTPQYGTHLAAEVGTRVAFRRTGKYAAGDQPLGEQHLAHRRLG